MKVVIKDVRLAFANIFDAKSVNGGEASFSAAFPIAPGSENAKACTAALEAVAKEKWGAKAADILKKLRDDGRVAFKTKPLSDSEGQAYDGFAGMHSLNASNKARPLIIDRQKQPLTAQDGRPYSGCYVNVTVDFWAQDNQWGKRVNATLTGVQFVRDGDAFGSGRAASVDDFEDLGEGVDEEMPV